MNISASNEVFVGNPAVKRYSSSPCSNKLSNNINNKYSISNEKNNSYQLSPENYIYYLPNLTFSNAKKKELYPHTVSFMGKMVHIVDGGNHATNMEHFAHAISSDIDTKIYEVETNPNDKNTKQLKSLEEQLRNLNIKKSFKDEYVAIPALASVPILNIQDQYNRVMGDNKKFTPENIKANKKCLLAFLKEIYNNPEYYRTYINYMDSNNQGIEYTYGVIQQINKLKAKGAKVYVPSGHPQDETLKWMAAQRGLKPELYYCIATGNDKDNCVKIMHKEIKDKNWYNFNLLSLSDANIVGVKGVTGAQDYMFAAYDSCITDGARGVYNFSPVVNEENELIGYSYTDTLTNEYPFEEFPANDEVENLVKFVGKNYRNVLATKLETEELKKCISAGISTSKCADKLYMVKDIFSETEIENEKMKLQGEYVDKSLKLFFSKNYKGEIIFPKCDCEGSGKPSVLSMWGSCFAVFNAIARDISLEVNNLSTIGEASHCDKIKCLKNQGKWSYEHNFIKQAEDYFNNAINSDKAFSIKNPDYFLDFEPYYLLGNLHYKNQKYDYASSCYNNAIDLLSKYILEKEKMNIEDIYRDYQAYYSSKQASELYDMAVKKYNTKTYLAKLFFKKPEKPSNYNNYKNSGINFELYDKVMLVANMYKNLSDICKLKNENYPSEVCKMAAIDIKNLTQRGNKVMEYRAQGIRYIGDLYNEIAID